MGFENQISYFMRSICAVFDRACVRLYKDPSWTRSLSWSRFARTVDEDSCWSSANISGFGEHVWSLHVECACSP